MPTSTQVQLVSRPTGWPTEENFRTVHVDLPDLADGEVRVAHECVSVDPVVWDVAAGLHTSRLDGSPLVYNNPDPWLPDLMVCRAEHASRLLAAVVQIEGSR